jgi:hypothetical protein
VKNQRSMNGTMNPMCRVRPDASPEAFDEMT